MIAQVKERLETKSNRARGWLPVLIVSLGLITAALCWGAAGYFIVGFYENDPQIPAMLSAGLFCLTIATIGALPAFITAILTRRVIPGVNSRRIGQVIIGFNLPWIGLGIVLAFASGLIWYWGAIACLIALIFTIWGLALYRLA